MLRIESLPTSGCLPYRPAVQNYRISSVPRYFHYHRWLTVRAAHRLAWEVVRTVLPGCPWGLPSAGPAAGAARVGLPHLPVVWHYPTAVSRDPVSAFSFHYWILRPGWLVGVEGLEMMRASGRSWTWSRGAVLSRQWRLGPASRELIVV
jgi:hypothetical protein